MAQGFSGAPSQFTIQRFLQIRVTDSQANNAIASSIAGDIRAMVSGTIIDAYAYVDTAGVTGTQTVNIKKNGTTIFSTVISIDSTVKNSKDSASQPVLSVTSVTANDIFTVDVSAVHTTPAKGLTVVIAIAQ